MTLSNIYYNCYRPGEKHNSPSDINIDDKINCELCGRDYPHSCEPENIHFGNRVMSKVEFHFKHHIGIKTRIKMNRKHSRQKICINRRKMQTKIRRAQLDDRWVEKSWDF